MFEPRPARGRAGIARRPEPAAAARSGGPGAAPAAPHAPSGPAKRFCRGMRPGPMLAPPQSSTEWRSGHSPRMIWPPRAALACRSGADRQSRSSQFPRAAATMRPFMRKTCCAMRRGRRRAGRAGGGPCRAAWWPARTGAPGVGSRAWKWRAWIRRRPAAAPTSTHGGVPAAAALPRGLGQRPSYARPAACAGRRCTAAGAPGCRTLRRKSVLLRTFPALPRNPRLEGALAAVSVSAPLRADKPRRGRCRALPAAGVPRLRPFARGNVAACAAPPGRPAPLTLTGRAGALPRAGPPPWPRPRSCRRTRA